MENPTAEREKERPLAAYGAGREHSPGGDLQGPPIRAFGLPGRPAFGDFAPPNDYAQRTARYAHSTASDRQATDLGKYRQQWEKLEGRELPRQQAQTKAQTIKRDHSPGMSH